MGQKFMIVKDSRLWSLKNWEEVIDWHNLPFYKRWFIKKPIFEYIEIK